MAYDRTGETRVAANNKSEIYYRLGGRIVVSIAIIINNYCIHFVSFDIKLQFNSSLRVRHLMRKQNGEGEREREREPSRNKQAHVC